jgi:hypothetical protein
LRIPTIGRLQYKLADSGYSSAISGSASSSSASTQSATEYWSLAKCKKAYTTYLSSKNPEIEEQKNARRYYHGSHWTEEEIAALKKRRQPVVTFNRIARKINGTVGHVCARRGDPKAFAENPQHDAGANLVTAALRQACDDGEWESKCWAATLNAAVDGIAGVELELKPSKRYGDTNVDFEVVDPDSFFYDPRSYRPDFSDAGYMGVGKWMDMDSAKELANGKEAMLDACEETELTSSPDREKAWFQSDGVTKHVRVVEVWYKHKKGYCWTLFCGAGVLMEGESPFVDDEGEQYSKYQMFSAAVDHDGDRYGFVRNLKSANDEINHRRSKGLHELNTRRIIAEKGAFDDIEVARREAARPDGIIERNPQMEALFDDTHKMANIEGNFKFLEDARNEIENFGFNPALVGQGVQDMSGRAIQLQQQAGMAELGPFTAAYRDWRIRFYNALWFAIRKNWSGPRFISLVAADGQEQQPVQINQLSRDPVTGAPTMVNALDQIDVKIILDEGPDTVTIAQETHETLAAILQAVGPMLSPAEARAAVRMYLNTSQIPAKDKKVFTDAAEQSQQPDPMQEQAKAAELQKLVGEGQEKQASALLKQAQAEKTMVEAQMHPQAVMMDAQGQPMPMEPQEYEVPPELQNAQAVADIEKTYSERDKNLAAAHKQHQEAELAPQKMMVEQQNAAADRAMAAKNADADRKVKAQQVKNRPAQR